jgi:4-amino-4-deoxy-L-arabinose transferase-like glycosyltransferase
LDSPGLERAPATSGGREIRRFFPAAAAVVLAYFLFFFGLTGAGLLGPDEPRYASIGREMALSGDWVTPRLWGEPWYEKPALLYWMTGAAYRLGLKGELAPRLPVALMSAGFVLAFFLMMRREFGARAAAYGASILATSAGWVAYGHVAVTDLPMAALFSSFMLLSLGWVDRGDRRALPVAAALLGLAVLAKGLVPLVLALPLAWAGRRRFFDWLRPPVAGAFLVTAVPWYALCYARNGMPFVREFFWEHHFERVSSEALQHVQPFWFYVPVLAAGLFPWTPALAALVSPSLYRDRRVRLLLAWLVFGLVFFSVPVNKLPGYLLPLLPAAAGLAGISLDRMRRAGWLLAACCLPLVLIGPLVKVLPEALASGLSRSALPAFHWMWLAPAALAPLVWWLDAAGRRAWAVALVASGTVVAVAVLQAFALPAIDHLATVRPVWNRIAGERGSYCVESVHRNWRYGLNYYSVTPLPDCSDEPRPMRLYSDGSAPLTVRSGTLYPRLSLRRAPGF